MKKILFFKFFLIVLSGTISFWLLKKTYVEWKNFKILDKKTAVKIIQWEIDEQKDGKFVIAAKYDYSIAGQKIIGKTFFEKRKFLNYETAFKTLNKLAKKDWQAWYSSKNVKISNLEKYFPLKNCIYSFISIAIFIYFILLYKKFENKFGFK